MASKVEAIRTAAVTAAGPEQLNRSLVDGIPAGARIVLIGEASHGTKEFYEQRAALTQMLIEERGFVGVLCEADFPDAFRVNMYVRGSKEVASADDALSGFKVGWPARRPRTAAAE
jgi:erythromycin esterase-like protein